MTRYFFDIRNGDKLTADQEGLDLATLDAVREEAAASLADMARASLVKHAYRAHELAIEVRDDHGSIMLATFAFGIQCTNRHGAESPC